MPRQRLIVFREGTAAQWAAANPVLLEAEPGFDTTNRLFKIGDGVTAWASLTTAGTISTSGDVTIGGALDHNGSTAGFFGAALVARSTGWVAATGTATRATFATGTVTLPVLAEHVKALIDDLLSLGLIGA